MEELIGKSFSRQSILLVWSDGGFTLAVMISDAMDFESIFRKPKQLAKEHPSYSY
jgi:hypothetical protein